MLRAVTLALLCAACPLIGCAAPSRHAASSERGSGASRQQATDAEWDDAVPAAASTALVFRPPIASDLPPLDLDRTSRQRSAFFGYEEGTTEYYSILTIDRQVSGGYYGRGFGSGYGSGSGGYLDRYERRAVIEKTGVVRR